MNNDLNTHIGRTLATIRTQLGMEQKEFAQKIGISQGNLSNIETGRRRITVDALHALKAVFNVNINVLFDADEKDYFITQKPKKPKMIKPKLVEIQKELEELIKGL